MKSKCFMMSIPLKCNYRRGSVTLVSLIQWRNFPGKPLQRPLLVSNLKVSFLMSLAATDIHCYILPIPLNQNFLSLSYLIVCRAFLEVSLSIHLFIHNRIRGCEILWSHRCHSSNQEVGRDSLEHGALESGLLERSNSEGTPGLGQERWILVHISWVLRVIHARKSGIGGYDF